MTEGTPWSPVCQKCGGRGNVQVVPPPAMVFAGRLRPDATKPYTFGTRVRCTRCNAWFILGPGTEWRPVEGVFKGGSKLPQRPTERGVTLDEYGESAPDETLQGEE